MKKVLSFVLVLSMILGSFGMAFAAAPADVVGKDYEDAVNVLMELGVVDGYKDGSYRPENIVTRAEMATLLIKAMGLADYAVGKSSFSDMAGHWADPFVAYASSLGIVAGYADGTFKPDVTVSYDQAITMVIQALGYKGEYLVGGFPGAFVNQAKALGILDGIVSGAAGANRGDVATLLYNSLTENFVRYSTDGVLQMSETDDMMARLGAVEDEKKVITGEEDALINVKEYQGAYVQTYKTNDADAEIVAVEVLSTFVVGDFVEEDDAIVFETADAQYKLGKVAVQDVYAFFENGDELEAEDEAYMTYNELKTGLVEDVVMAVKVEGKYITKVYSAAVWNDGVTLLWTEELAEELAEDQTMNDVAFEEDNNDEIKMEEVVLLGVESLEDIEEDDVVTYYVAGGYVVKVEVSKEVVEGKITKVNKDGEMIINGKAYAVREDAEGNQDLLAESDAVELTAEGKFFLNYAGEIVYAEAASTAADDFAIVTLTNKFDTKAYGDSDVMKIKMITVDGKESIYVIDKDYVEDEEAPIVEDAIPADKLIAYNLNKDGEIDKIEDRTTTAAIGEVTAKGFLDGKKIADDVVVFEYDAEEDEYALADLKDVPVGEELGATSYYYNAEDEEIEVIILAGEYGADDESVYGVVVTWTEGLDADDEEIYNLSMLVDGAAKEYDSTTDYVLDSEAVLYEIKFDGSAVANTVEVTDGYDDGKVTVVSSTVAGIKAGNIDLANDEYGYIEVAADVVVYAVDEDGNIVEKAAKFADIDEEDTVIMYELDGADDDKDGVDVIIFTEA